MSKVIRIEPSIPVLKPKKKVAAYARVSMESNRMHHSLSAQVSYYNDLIQKNPEWQFAGVFADYGISGTGIAKREEFLRMLEAAENGEIDIILTKSIQRFARNTVDLLNTVRHLKNIGVEVRFEKEHISSMSKDGELMLTILASFAQEESYSLSENMKWGIRKRFEQGIPHGHFRVYGYRWEGDMLAIVPEEAEVVKRIYRDYLAGKSRAEIGRELMAAGITTRAGCPWEHSNIWKILTNVIYTGNLLLQKMFNANPLHRHQVKNQGQLPQYLVENSHPAIIDQATFAAVQVEMERRKALGPLANKSLNTCCFTGKIKCPHCGVSYTHCRRKDGGSKEFWICGTKKIKGGKCPVPGTVNHSTLEKLCAEVLGLENFDERVFREKVDFINVPARNRLEFHLTNGEVVTRNFQNTGQKDSWTAERRAKVSAQRKKKPICYHATVFTGKIRCARCGCNFRRAMHSSATMEDGKFYYWRCHGNRAGCGSIGLREDLLKPFIAEVIGMDEFHDAVFGEIVEYIEVNGTLLYFHFSDGSIICRDWEKRRVVPGKKTREVINGSFTPELRKQLSERMKQTRKEKREACSKEK